MESSDRNKKLSDQDVLALKEHTKRRIYANEDFVISDVPEFNAP